MYGNSEMSTTGVVGCIFKIFFMILAKCEGWLNIKVWLLVLCILGACVVPGGMTILFIVFKLTHVLTLGWGWIAMTIFLDLLSFGLYSDML